MVVIVSAKTCRGHSRAQQKRIRSAIRKKLRSDGIHVTQFGSLWFAVADHVSTTLDIEKRILEHTLRSNSISSLDLHGSYGFEDFFNLRAARTPYTAEFCMARLGMKLASNVMRLGNACWPAFVDLHRSLPTLLNPTPGKSRLVVAIGEHHV
ncbi:MAG: hypothetical protein KGN37_17280 [Burkholderiales bacterium]|nr:hypothetical protein [Burkholderiales bacterium]